MHPSVHQTCATLLLLLALQMLKQFNVLALTPNKRNSFQVDEFYSGPGIRRVSPLKLKQNDNMNNLNNMQHSNTDKIDEGPKTTNKDENVDTNKNMKVRHNNDSAILNFEKVSVTQPDFEVPVLPNLEKNSSQKIQSINDEMGNGTNMYENLPSKEDGTVFPVDEEQTDISITKQQIAEVIQQHCIDILNNFSTMCQCMQYHDSVLQRRKRASDDVIMREQTTLHNTKRTQQNLSKDTVLGTHENLYSKLIPKTNSSESSSGTNDARSREKRDPDSESYISAVTALLLDDVTLRLECGCNGDQILHLTGISALPRSVKQLLVSDCRGGHVVLGSSFGSGDSRLRKLSFNNIKMLSLQGGALDINLRGDGQKTNFQMELKNIGLLQIARGAIRLSGTNCESSFLWKNIILEGLPSFSITSANLVNFTMDGILIKGIVQTAAINLESSGTKLKLKEIDARAGVESGFVSGDLTELSISKCRLNLAPGAFQQISFRKSHPKIVIRNNIFGDSRWSESVYPSLSSGVFDFNFHDDSALFNLSRNDANCSVGNLGWLLEHKKSTVLHWLRCGLLKTLSCHDQTLKPPTHETCNFGEILSHTPASRNFVQTTDLNLDEMATRDKRSFNESNSLSHNQINTLHASNSHHEERHKNTEAKNHAHYHAHNKTNETTTSKQQNYLREKPEHGGNTFTEYTAIETPDYSSGGILNARNKQKLLEAVRELQRGSTTSAHYDYRHEFDAKGLYGSYDKEDNRAAVGTATDLEKVYHNTVQNTAAATAVLAHCAPMTVVCLLSTLATFCLHNSSVMFRYE